LLSIFLSCARGILEYRSLSGFLLYWHQTRAPLFVHKEPSKSSASVLVSVQPTSNSTLSFPESPPPAHFSSSFAPPVSALKSSAIEQFFPISVPLQDPLSYFSLFPSFSDQTPAMTDQFLPSVPFTSMSTNFFLPGQYFLLWKEVCGPLLFPGFYGGWGPPFLEPIDLLVPVPSLTFLALFGLDDSCYRSPRGRKPTFFLSLRDC